MNTNDNTQILLKSIKMNNMANNPKEVEINFSDQMTEFERYHFFTDALFNKREDSKFPSGILKTLSIFGRNSSYKTSVVEAVNRIIKFTIYFDYVKLATIDLKRWTIKNTNSTSFLQEAFYFAGKNLHRHNVSNDEIQAIYGRYAKHIATTRTSDEIARNAKEVISQFYEKNVHNPKNPLRFEINYTSKNNLISQKIQDRLENTKIELIIWKSTENEIEYELKIDDNEIQLGEKKISSLPFSSHFISVTKFEHLLDVRSIFKNGMHIDIINFLCTQVFKDDISQMSSFFNYLDPSIKKFRVTEIDKDSDWIQAYSLSRTVGANSAWKEISLSQLSRGTKNFIWLIYKILNTSANLIIIDEIEISLHLRYSELIIDLVNKIGKQLLFTTHSPLIVQNILIKKQIYIFEIDEETGELTYEKASKKFKPTHSLINKYLEDVVSSPSQLSTDSILDSLGEYS